MIKSGYASEGSRVTGRRRARMAAVKKPDTFLLRVWVAPKAATRAALDSMTYLRAEHHKLRPMDPISRDFRLGFTHKLRLSRRVTTELTSEIVRH